MKMCKKCGRMSENKNAMICNYCGGNLIVSSSTVCENCGAVVDGSSSFCGNCGALIKANSEPAYAMPYGTTYHAPEETAYMRESVDSGKSDSKKTMIIAVSIIVAACIIALAIVAVSFLMNDKDSGSGSEDTATEENENKNGKDNTNEDDTNAETSPDDSLADEKDNDNGNENQPRSDDKEEKEHEKPENQQEDQDRKDEEPAPDDDYEAEEAQKQEDFMLLESVVDGYVNSFVTALNNRDSSYMLDYTIPGTSSNNVYKTQSEFIHKGKYIYEEYVDSYITSDIKYESSSTCVITVREIYNVVESDGTERRQVQEVNYRMKHDSYGNWKVYEFVGKVKVV